jgi:hypothetical protein
MGEGESFEPNIQGNRLQTKPVRLAVKPQTSQPASDFPIHNSASSNSPSLVCGGELVSFDRQELREILNLYGRKVAEGEWRDYAIDFSPQKAVFAIYRRASECALYRIEKNPKLARKQGAFSVVSVTGLILKRGPDLRRVLEVLDKKLKLVST